jgi:hypothetical protein
MMGISRVSAYAESVYPIAGSCSPKFGVGLPIRQLHKVEDLLSRSLYFPLSFSTFYFSFRLSPHRPA